MRKILEERLLNAQIDFECFKNDALAGTIMAYQDCLNLLDKYNIITAPKEIKLSEIVSKLENDCCYDKVIIVRNSTYTRVVGRMLHHLYSSTKPLFDFNIEGKIDKPNDFNYKWLYKLWIAGTKIIDDLEKQDEQH